MTEFRKMKRCHAPKGQFIIQTHTTNLNHSVSEEFSFCVIIVLLEQGYLKELSEKMERFRI